MKIEVHNRCSVFQSYRAARVKAMFNADSGCNFDLVAELPIDVLKWRIGLVVGPSGSGKTSIGRKLWGSDAMFEASWSGRNPIIDALAPRADFNNVTAAFAAVGFEEGTQAAWLRPYRVLSNGEQFREIKSIRIAGVPLA